MTDYTRSPEKLVPILGKTFVHRLIDQPVLQIGKDAWSRRDVALLGVTHTLACANLTKVAKDLGVTSTKDLYQSTSPYTFADYPVGVTTLYVMFAIFRDKELDVDTWYAKGLKGALATFVTLKHRELEAHRRTKEDMARERRAQRRTQHEADVKRVLNQRSV
jgi:hypothetical protein